MDIITLALAKKFATKISAGYSKVEVDGMDIIFTLNDGSQVTLTVPAPADGVSVTDLDINENNELICTMSDGSTINAGEVPVADLSEYAKIEYVDEENQKLKEELDSMKMVYNTMPKVSGEGTDLTLNNTAECPIYDIELSPSELEQKSTTGRNILNPEWWSDGNNLTSVQDGSKFTITTKSGSGRTSTGQTLTDLLQANVGKTIAWTYKSMDISQYSSSNQTIALIAYRLEEDTTTRYACQLATTYNNSWVIPDNISFASLYMYGNNNNNTLISDNIVVFDELMLQISDTISTEWEPYTGGAIPRPDYPQEIHTISGENNVKIQNENLLNRITCSENVSLTWVDGIENTETGSLASNYIRINIGDKIICSYQCSKMFYDKNKNYIGFLKSNETLSKVAGSPNIRSYFTVPNYSEIYYVRLAFRATYSSEVNLLTANIMVNKGTTLLDYVPHKEQSLPLSLGDLEYCKIEDYEDLFFKNVVGSEYYDSTLELDKWYLKKNTLKYGSLHTRTWTLNNKVFYASINVRKPDTITTQNIYCPVYKWNGNYSTVSYANVNMNNNEIATNNNGTSTNILIRDDRFETTNDLVSYLSTNNIFAYIVLTTPTNILLSNTLQIQLDNIHKAISYKNKTNVSQENNDLPFIIKLSAIKDISSL